MTDTNGMFSVTFTPSAGEAGGIYNAWVVHPDLSDRQIQATFAISGVLASPSHFGVRASHYFA